MIKRIVPLVILSCLLIAQNPNTAVFPTSVADDEDLLVQSNQSTTTLNGPIDNTTLSLSLTDASSFVFPGIITIGAERIKVCSKSGNNLTVCTGGRGFDGSSATSHSTGVTVYGYLTRYEHNQLAAEIKAIELSLTAGSLTHIGGPTGAIVVDSTVTPREIDIDTTIVPRLGSSNTVSGTWTFTPGLVLGAGTEPTCNASTRGRIVFTQGAVDVADTARICSKDSANVYAWRTLL